MGNSDRLESSDKGPDSDTDSDSSDSNDRSRRQRYPIPLIHKLYAGRNPHTEGEDRDEPYVVWSIQVYDSTIPNSPRASVIYKSDKPLEIGPGTETKKAARAPSTTTSADTLLPSTWTECIFEVSRETLAYLPPHRSSRETDHSVNESVTIEALQFTRVFQRHIRIESPFLHRKLVALAGYYPEVLRFNNVIAQKAWNELMPLRIYEPWGFLFHRFLEMKSLVDTSETQDPPHDKGLDAHDRDIERLENEHLRYLVEFLEPYYNTRVVPWISSLGQQDPELPFSILWYVFYPGIDVYCMRNGVITPCVVISLRDAWPRRPSEERIDEGWYLKMWYLDSDGQYIGRVEFESVITFYTGVRTLTSLNVCPVTNWDAHDKGERRNKIMKCNKLVLESLQKGYLLASYNGPVLGSNRNYSGTIVIDYRRGMSSMKVHPSLLHKVEDYSSRFIGYDMMRINETELDNSYDTGLTMGFPDSFGSNFNPDPRIPPSRPRIAPPQPDRLGIDFTRERSWHPDDAYYPKVKYRHEPNPLYEPYDGLTTGEISKPSLPSLTTSLSDHQLLLLRPSIYAFALKTKEWLVVHPERLREFTQSDEGIENLVLGEEEMKTIKGLSRRQNSKRETWAADFIEGKGRGQIILLHGPPGVGKTYTVEAIAQYLRRPLLTLTVTDIGTKETDVEHQLIKWFTLAEAWNAVLLVDEADIFLERRQNRDLARNGLVSAFLRRMEYFSGLLFLTTNRVGQIDDAFISRVHVAIGYDALTPEGRSKVWQGFFRKLARERAGKIQISSSAKKWVLEKAISGEAQLNGRDIRNALQTAITLAEAECEEDPEFEPDTMVIVVDQSHFQRVVEITNKFHSYVQSIRREDEKKRAAGRYDRNDYWKGEIRREEQKKSEP